MKALKRVSFVILIFAVMLQLIPAGIVSAADTTLQEPLQKLRPDENAKPYIGYNEFDRNYMNLTWDPVSYPGDASGRYINFYLQEINKPYRPTNGVTLKERDVAGSSTSIKLKNLESGTIYYTFAKAYHTHTVEGTTVTSPESAASNSVKFMTDIDIAAYSCGPKQIKITWDDVWDNGRRIDYKLYVSENKDFSGTPPIYINQSHIGSNGSVKVNEVTGKLEYIHTVRDAGRVYYIKIEPDISDTELKRSESSKTLTVASFILVKTSRVSSAEIGTVWRLDWTPVVTGLNSSNIKCIYQIYRGEVGTNNPEQYVASEEDTSWFITVNEEEQEYYYIIKATITKDGQPLYPDIKIESDKIIVKESDAAAIPVMPEIVNELSGIYSVVNANDATILWRAPLKGDNKVDYDTHYDIWLITDPDMIDNPPDSMKIASDISISTSNYVLDNKQNVIGYKYSLTGLSPNTIYYFKITAKKSFVEYTDEGLENVTYSSDPAIKVIITPTQGSMDQPVTPPKNTVVIKQVTSTSATIQLKNKWYEHYENDVWVYKTRQELDAIDSTLVAKLETGTLNDNTYRISQYDSGVTFDVGCIAYKDGMVYEDLSALPTNKIMGFPTIANDPLEDADLNYDGKKHNVNITLTDLEPNTAYIIWARASRVSADKTSFPSNPLIVTTNPEVVTPVETPTVPVFNYCYAGDTYVDLAWNFKLDSNYKYTIKYGDSDNINSVKGEMGITSQQIKDSGKSYIRITGLATDTIYYFWIQAEAAPGESNSKKSEWSDSYLVKTLPDLPPSTPAGFGIKNGQNYVTKDSITFEWVQETNMAYILELSGNPNFADSKEFIVGKASEYKAAGLRSNYRYYARLYAYDPVKKLRSAPTQTVICRTERSRDDYDSDENIENVEDGDLIVKDSLVIDHIWNVEITGANADRLIELIQSDNTLDYSIDLDSPPKGAENIRISVSSRVFGALAALKENLIIKTPANMLVFRPGTLMADTAAISADPNDFEYVINVKFTNINPRNLVNLTLKTPASSVLVSARSGGANIPVNKFNKDLRLVYSYGQRSWYRDGTTSGYIYNEKAAGWEKAITKASYDTVTETGKLTFETGKPAQTAVGEQGTNYFSDIDKCWAKNSIINVAKLHPLKSIKNRKFNPDSHAAVGDAVKFMLDVLDVNYSDNYLALAVKSGIVVNADILSPNKAVTREKTIAMAVRVCELKTGTKAKPSGTYTGGFKDLGSVSSSLSSRVRFAIQNGITTSRYKGTLGPKDPVTRAEVMVILEKVLEYAGEL